MVPAAPNPAPAAIRRRMAPCVETFLPCLIPETGVEVVILLLAVFNQDQPQGVRSRIGILESHPVSGSVCAA